MSFDIHGFDAASSSAGDGDGIIIFRFGSETSVSVVRELAESLVSAGVLASSETSSADGALAAFRWRVPSQDEQSAQKRAIEEAGAGVVEAWAFSQAAEVDLTDWFAPRWRSAPASAARPDFAVGPPPEVVTWEGFGLTLDFERDIDEAEAHVVRTIADLWLAGLADRSATGSLGSRCYRRSIIARRGARRVVVGVEGLANPGTDAEAVGHILWLAQMIGKVLPVASANFVSLLPQDGDTIEADVETPQPRRERATREWRGGKISVGDDTRTDAMSLGALLADETRAEPGDGASEDGWADAETAHLNRDEIDDALQATRAGSSDDGWGDADTAHLNRAEIDDALSILDEVGEWETQPLESDEVTAPVEGPARGGVTNGVTADVAVVTADELLVALGEALEEGDLESSLAAFDAINSPVGLAAAGQLLLEVAETLDAEDWDDIPILLELTRRIIPTEPESSSAHLLAIAALCRLGRGSEAIDIGLAHQQRPDVLFELYERLCVFRRTGETPALYAALAEHGHKGVGAHYYNLGCKLHKSQLEVALALYRGAIAIGAPAPQPTINAGIALMALGRASEALELTRSALESHPKEPNLWANLIDLENRLDAAELPASLDAAIAVIGNSDRCGDCEHADAPASCPTGCGALLADCVDALSGSGALDAVALIERHSGEDSALTVRVVCAKAQALVCSDDLAGARELLDHRIDTADATSSAYYRARANLERVAGNEQVAVGLAIAALHADRQVAQQMHRDPIADIVSALVFDGGAPPRPPTVPEDARWIASDAEWELGGVDDHGSKQGPYRYYRPDGTLCNECALEDDLPHGEFVRYHESGEVSQKGTFDEGALHGTRIWVASNLTSSEQMHGEQISPLIRRSEMDYVRGRVVGVRHFNSEGVLCAPSGEPYPDRPGDVGEDAFFRAEERQWVAGEVDADGQRRGAWRVWNEGGVLLEESEYAGGERHGAFRAYFADGTLSVEGQYESGEKRGTFVYQRRGEEEHEDFPVAASAVAVAEESYDTQIPAVRLYDRSGREVTIDGTPLEEWQSAHPELAEWYTQVWQVPWPELDDASGNAHRLPHILVGLLAVDENISDFVYRALHWHLYNEGNVYSGTAAAVPFLVRLCETETTPRRGALCNFIRHAGIYPAAALEEAASTGDHAVVSTSDALMKRIDVFVKLLSADDVDLRAAAGAIVGGAFPRADEMASELAGALSREENEIVRASHMFSLARLETVDALIVVESQLDTDSALVAASSAMALVMARGEKAGGRVADRLVNALVDFSDELGEGYARSPWSDDHIVTEIAQALHYATEGTTAIDMLCAAFGRITSSDGIAAVAGALMIAVSVGEGLSPEVQQVLSAIADCDSLWTLGDALTDLLEGYELPTEPEALREWSLGD